VTGQLSLVDARVSWRQVRVFDCETFACDALCGHSDIVLCVDVSFDGRYVVSSGKDHTVRVWDLESRECVAVGTGHNEAVGAVTDEFTLFSLFLLFLARLPYRTQPPAHPRLLAHRSAGPKNPTSSSCRGPRTVRSSYGTSKG